MSITEALKNAGYVAEKSTAGGKRILTGIYKCAFVSFKPQEDKGYGESIRADFKIEEKLSGDEPYSQFPEFVGFFSTHPDKIASKRNGLAKLLDGLFSVGIDVDKSSDEKLSESLNNAINASVYISAYIQKPQKKDGDKWVENPDADPKQGFTFMTQKNAEKEAKKKESAPF